MKDIMIMQLEQARYESFQHIGIHHIGIDQVGPLLSVLDEIGEQGCIPALDNQYCELLGIFYQAFKHPGWEAQCTCI